jgi:hypothetical protein
MSLNPPKTRKNPIIKLVMSVLTRKDATEDVAIAATKISIIITIRGVYELLADFCPRLVVATADCSTSFIPQIGHCPLWTC